MIIALGTNDGSVGKTAFDKDGFKRQFIAFVKELYMKYGYDLDVIIFEAVFHLPDFVKEAYIESIKENHLDIEYVTSNASELGGILPSGHPNKEMHFYAAKELKVYLQKRYNL